VVKFAGGLAGGGASLGMGAVEWACSVRKCGRRAGGAKEFASWVAGMVWWGRGAAGRVQVGCGQCLAWLGALDKLVSGWLAKFLCRGGARTWGGCPWYISSSQRVECGMQVGVSKVEEQLQVGGQWWLDQEEESWVWCKPGGSSKAGWGQGRLKLGYLKLARALLLW